MTNLSKEIKQLFLGFSSNSFMKNKIEDLIKKYSYEEVRNEAEDFLRSVWFGENPSEKEVQKVLNNYVPLDLKRTGDKIKEIKNTSTKLPTRRLKLESVVDKLSKELLNAPPHYTTDGYNVILTSDINEGNISSFLTRFRAGRVISYGRVSDNMNEFSKELVLKTISYNKLALDNNFFYVIYEDVR